jgi:hypothetical protein
LGPGVHWCLWCCRSEVLIKFVALDVLAMLARPLQRDSGVLSHTPAVEFCSKVVGLCALTEGERTDADASCWRQDDRGLDLVEVECAMPSSRSTSSRHCFMAPGEAVELGGCRSNSLPADNAPGVTLNGVRDVCVAVCCRAACTAAVLGTGRLGTSGVEEAASSSTSKSTEVSACCSMICTIMLSGETSKNLKPSPYLARQMSERKSLAGWRSAPTLNPKMRRGLSVLLVSRKMGRTQEHIRV